jgi:hypothetical protein
MNLSTGFDSDDDFVEMDWKLWLKNDYFNSVRVTVTE